MGSIDAAEAGYIHTYRSGGCAMCDEDVAFCCCWRDEGRTGSVEGREKMTPQRRPDEAPACHTQSTRSAVRRAQSLSFFPSSSIHLLYTYLQRTLLVHAHFIAQESRRYITRPRAHWLLPWRCDSVCRPAPMPEDASIRSPTA